MKLVLCAALAATLATAANAGQVPSGTCPNLKGAVIKATTEEQGIVIVAGDQMPHHSYFDYEVARDAALHLANTLDRQAFICPVTVAGKTVGYIPTAR